MADPRSRLSGRRSPTYNPARASMPVNIGYNLPSFTENLHAVPAARYESVPRRHDSKSGSGAAPGPTTITTYNVTSAKEPLPRSHSKARTRSSTLDTLGPKPIIVTTNHPRPHASSSHSSNHSNTRGASPPRDSYRAADNSYYAQPASSIRSRSHHRHSQSYNQGAPLGDEFSRLRERTGGATEDRFWAPTRASTDNFRNVRPHSLYATPAHPATPATPAYHAAPAYGSNTAVADYEDDYYEYTKPGELARYDLDHDRDQRRSRRDSFERPYYRPHVNVVSNDTTRYDARPRAKPPASSGLDRYNRAQAAGAYDRPTVTMPAPPAVPPPPPLDTQRRPAALLEGPRSPSIERRETRPRPISLYQDAPTRSSHPDDLYRTRDDGFHRDRRDRDEGYRDDDVTARGFGIRTDTLDQPRSVSALPAHTYEDRRSRHEPVERDSKRSDETRSHRSPERASTDDRRPRADSRDRKETISRRDSVREKVSAGLKGAAAALAPAIGLGMKNEDKVSPRRRGTDDDRLDSRAVEKVPSKEKDLLDRKSSPRDDPIVVEQRRDRGRDRGESLSESKDRDIDRERERERERQREREREREREYERERERERDRNRDRDRDRDHEKESARERGRDPDRDQREHDRRDAEAKLNGVSHDRRDRSPDDAVSTSRRRPRPSSAAFDPTDTKGLMDLKKELAAMDSQSNATEKADRSDRPVSREPVSDKALMAPEDSDRYSESRDDESRGREMVPAGEKTVRVVSPPRDKSDQKPIKGILKAPKVRFPEEDNPIREGVAPHKDDKTKKDKDIPAGARWTKISRKRVNPEALTIGKERFEIRDDFVIVLRVLNKEEIQAYATATAQIRDRKRKEHERDRRHEQLSDDDQVRSDEERQRRNRARQETEDDGYRRGRVVDDRPRRHDEERSKNSDYHRHYDSGANGSERDRR
ncbi:hypothetical protein GGR57DRAFT_251882 [Xylariaceae sp. FL1272]|nr:hypothetical protein GGR57DRAFT_251882 [Xylariaceae sp. FL1272]